MAVRSIRLFGDPVLRAATVPIDEIDDGVRALVADPSAQNSDDAAFTARLDDLAARPLPTSMLTEAS